MRNVLEMRALMPIDLNYSLQKMEKIVKTDQLFSEFPPVSTEQWEAKIEQDLKGADYEKKLVWKTTEGFKVKPYYRTEDLEANNSLLKSLPGQFPYLRGTTRGSNQWLIAQDIESSNINEANKIAVDALSRGADALTINASKVLTVQDLKSLTEGIDPQKATLCFNSAHSYIKLFDFLNEVIIKDFKSFKGTFDFDPLSFVLINGDFYSSQDDDLMQGAEILKKSKAINGLRVLSVNGQYFHNAGSTLVQELGFALASANEYLSWYTSKGISIDDVSSKMTFIFATGGNYFMEIAKLRAARLLWAKIVEQYKPQSDESCKMYIHSVTSNFNKTIYDPYVNMLRTTTEAMSAAIGNADIITVLPFDLDYKEPDDFSLRISRNQQIILKEESNLDKVIDPAAGSYYIENLTASLAEQAWKIFLSIEEMGGMLEAIKKGYIQEEISASAKQKRDDIANRRTLILGTNQHPNIKERMLEKIQSESEDENIEIETLPLKEPRYKTIEIIRGADEFEDLRLATEVWENEGNKRPGVFLFTIGNPAMRKARAAFSAGFFGIAGYEIIDNPGFNSIDEGVKAAAKSNAEIIVICSSDEEYADLAADITRTVKLADPDKIVVVAGYPKEILNDLKSAGVDEFIHVRSNAFETLYNFQKKLEIML
ncbi:MAG TPA: methylmalonyl-CoA mutase family protein [Lentimicrobium sp.]|nr:methylmalonyl-CoA mutase family protein [Lentimicrobium sp.]